VIDSALQNLMLNLINDPECWAFLSSNWTGKDPIVEMTLAKFTASGDISPNSDAGVTPEGNVLINSTGPFFFPPEGPPGPDQKNWAGRVFPGATPQARSLILLHETGHLTKALVPDKYSWEQAKANNYAIIEHCQKTLGIK
jgi:hypothetical protein